MRIYVRTTRETWQIGVIKHQGVGDFHTRLSLTPIPNYDSLQLSFVDPHLPPGVYRGTRINARSTRPVFVSRNFDDSTGLPSPSPCAGKSENNHDTRRNWQHSA